ncbi:MAG TPA: hypothetical protein VGR70_01825 [Stellaceae bacterium]|nr:hypothetical protein [Stellaceae bacterium]
MIPPGLENLAAAVAELAEENQGLTLERAAIRLHALVNLLEREQEPFQLYVAIAAVAMTAASKLIEGEITQAGARWRQ